MNTLIPYLGDAMMYFSFLILIGVLVKCLSDRTSIKLWGEKKTIKEINDIKYAEFKEGLALKIKLDNEKFEKEGRDFRQQLKKWTLENKATDTSINLEEIADKVHTDKNSKHIQCRDCGASPRYFTNTLYWKCEYCGNITML